MSSWTDYRNPEGRTYWFNKETRESVWEKPDDLKTPFERALNQTKWKEYFSGGRKYYYNTESKESKWDMPDELLLLLEKVEKENQQTASATPTGGPLAITSGANASPAQSTANEPNGTNGVVGPHTGGILPFSSSGILPVRPNLPDDPVIPHNGFATVEEGEKAFFHLLRKAGVDANWSWDQTMRAIITDPLYKALNTLAEKKAAWQKFTDGLKAKEHEERENRLAKYRPAIRNMLKGNPNVFHYTTFTTADKLFAQHPIWQQAKIEAERRLIFEEYVAELKQREVQETRSARARSISKVVSLFKTLQVDVLTRWRNAHDLVLDSEEWRKDPELQKLPTLDILLAFEDYSRVREREFEEQMRRTQVEKTRKERKAREAFKELLGELVDSGKLKARTKWKEVYPSFSSDERYLSMLGNPGSNPLELFWDVVDGLDQKLDVKIAAVEEAIKTHNVKRGFGVAGADKNHEGEGDAMNVDGNEGANAGGFEVTTETSLDEFLTVLRENPVEATRELTVDDFQSVFQTMRDLALKKQADAKRRAERKQRHLQDDLRYALKKLSEPLDLNLAYEDAVPFMENLPEYKAIEGEDGRKAAFAKFVKRQKERLREVSEDGASTTSRKRKEPPREGPSERERERERERESEREKEKERDRREKDRERDRERDRGERERERERERGRSDRDRERERGKDYERDRDGGGGGKSGKYHRGYDEYESRGHRSSRGERDRDREREDEYERRRDEKEERRRDKDRDRDRERDRGREKEKEKDRKREHPRSLSRRDEKERGTPAKDEHPVRDRRAFGIYDEREERAEKRPRYEDVSMKDVSDDTKAPSQRADSPEEGEI